MLARVGFPDPEQAFRTYPFELSGGLRQRAMIAMALVCDPALLIADEPTTALDVTIQAQILQLMKELQSEFHMAILFITHDLGVVANMADEVVVLYRGQIMESGSCKALLSRPQHPYLQRAAARRAAAAHGAGRAPDAAARGLAGRPRAARQRLEGRPQRAGGERRARAGRCSRSRASARPSAPARAAGSAARRRRCWRSTTSASRSRAASLSGWSARAAAARPPSRRSSCARSAPMPAASPITPPKGRSTCWPCEGQELERFRRRLQYIFQDPFHSLNPRMTVYDIVAEPLVIHRHRQREGAYRAGQGAARRGRARRAPSAPLSAQLLRRPAPADRHRARAGARSRDADLRRAGLGARRLGPGADPQSAAGICRASSA